MEAYSKHPVVKKANDPGKLMDVGEFLRHVRQASWWISWSGRVLSHGRRRAGAGHYRLG